MLRTKTLVIIATLAIVPAMCMTTYGQTTGGGNTGGGTGGTVGGGTGGNTGTGGGLTGGTGSNNGLTAPADQLAAPEFEDIRREVRFAGQSLDTIVHPYSQSFTLQTDVNSIAGGSSATNTTGAARTTAGQAGTNVQSPFGGFNDPFQAAFFSQFQTQQAIIRSRLSFEASEFLPPPEGSVAARDSELANARRTQQVSSQIKRLPTGNNQSVQVQIVNGIATLSGVVESEARKKQMERLMNMEAGVRTVVNNLQIQ